MGYHALLLGIFLTQGSNPHPLYLLHWQVGCLPLATWEAQINYTSIKSILKIIKKKSCLEERKAQAGAHPTHEPGCTAGPATAALSLSPSFPGQHLGSPAPLSGFSKPFPLSFVFISSVLSQFCGVKLYFSAINPHFYLAPEHRFFSDFSRFQQQRLAICS